MASFRVAEVPQEKARADAAQPAVAPQMPGGILAHPAHPKRRNAALNPAACFVRSFKVFGV